MGEEVKSNNDVLLKKGEVPFSLPNEKVLVKPILRKGEFLPKNHSGSFMYSNTSMQLMLPLDPNTGKLINPLTEEEQKFFESSKAGLDLKPGDLSIYKKGKDNFWHNFKVKIKKANDIVSDNSILLTLNLSVPMDYITYKVLMSYTRITGGIVAPTWDDRFNSKTYKMVLVKENEQEIEKSVNVENKMKAYKFLDTIINSSQKMYEFLYIYYMESKYTGKPSPDASKEWYINEINKVIDNDLKGFMKVISNESLFKIKLLILKGIKAGALKMLNGNFELPEGKPIGKSLDETVKYFLEEKHQEDLLRVKGLIEQFENKK